MDDVGFIGRCGGDTVNQARDGIRTDVCFRPEIPLLTFPRLLHLRITSLGFVLRRWCSRKQRRIHHGATAKEQALAGKFLVDGLEHLLRQPVPLQQAPERQQGCGIRCRLVAEVHADEATDRLHVVDGVFGTLVGKTQDLLDHVHPQHALETDRRTAVARLGIEGFDLGHQRRPGNATVEFGEQLLAPGDALLSTEFGIRKADLVHRWPRQRRSRRIVASRAPGWQDQRDLISVT